MVPPTLHRRWLALAAWVAAGAISVVVSTQIYLSMFDHGHSWWVLFAWQLGCWGFWAAAAPVVVRTGMNTLTPGAGLSESAWRFLRLASFAMALTAAHIVLSGLWFVLLQPYVPVATYTFPASLWRALTSWLHVDPVIFILLLAVGYGLGGYRRARDAELQRSQLEGALSRAQLEALRLQIQPHFLMNTLHSIAALLRSRDNDQALHMLLGLSELLRTTLERSIRPEVPLGEEIRFVERYAELQRMRFSDRLQVELDVPAECSDLLVPTLLLQPLVENAIRHGVGRRAGPGVVSVRAAQENGDLRLEVLDDGPGFPADLDDSASAGIGLNNVRSRLAETYGEAARLEIRNHPEGGAVVGVTLPARSAALESGQ